MPIVILLINTLIFFRHEIFESQIIWGPDSPKIFYPLTLVLSNWLKSFHFPLWTPYIYFGYPLSSEGQLGLFYPPNWLHLFFGPGTTVNILTFASILFSGIFAYFFGRTIKLSKLASLIVGISFMFSGQLISHLQDLPKVYTYPYMPLILTFIYKSVEKKKIIYLFWASVFLALQTYPGHPNIPIITAIFSSLFLIFISLKTKSKKVIIRNLLVFLFLYFLLILPRIVDTLTILPLSLRTGRIDFTDATNGSLSFFDLISFIFPHFFFLNLHDWVFSPTFHFWTYWGSVEEAIYIGIPTFLLAFVGLKSKNNLKLFFLLTFVVFFIISLGKNTPFYQALIFKVPVLNGLRDPSRYMYVSDFALMLLAGFGLDFLLLAKRISKTLVILVSLPFLGIFLLPFLSNLIATNSFDFGLFLQKQYLPLGPSMSVDQIINGVIKSLSLTNPQTLTQIVFIFLSVALIESLIIFRKKAFGFGLIILLSIDLLVNVDPINLHRPNNPLLTPPKNLNLDQNYRLYTFMNFWSDYMPDQLLSQNILEGNGFTGLPLRRFAKYQQEAETEWLKESSGRLFTLGSIKKVYGDKNGQPNLVENDNVLPRAYVVSNYILQENEALIFQTLKAFSFDPFKTVLLEEKPEFGFTNKAFNQAKILAFFPSDNRVEIEASTRNPAFLVLTDTNFPGWNAEIDNKPTKIYQANYLFRAIYLPSGTHKIIFDYDPPYLKLALIISFLTFLSIIVFTFKNHGEK